MNIEKKTKSWVEADIITKSEQKAILKYESEHARSWGVLGFVWLGIFCIGLGIVSLIAFNWDEISNVVKLGADFALLGGISGLAWWYHSKGKSVGFEGCLFLIRGWHR